MSRIAINDLNNESSSISIINEEELDSILGGFRLRLFGVKILQIGGSKLDINVTNDGNSWGVDVTYDPNRT